MKRNVILTGFMGAGKTSVGQALSAATGMPLMDTDHLIEELAGMTISGIFALQGEDAFRKAETQVLERLLRETEDTVISVGGGLPLREENRRILKELGTVVFLRVKPETVLARLEGDTTRPLLQGDQVEQKVRELLALRNPVYQEAAHVVVDVDGRPVADIAEDLKAVAVRQREEG